MLSAVLCGRVAPRGVRSAASAALSRGASLSALSAQFGARRGAAAARAGLHVLAPGSRPAEGDEQPVRAPPPARARPGAATPLHLLPPKRWKSNLTEREVEVETINRDHDASADVTSDRRSGSPSWLRAEALDEAAAAAGAGAGADGEPGTGADPPPGGPADSLFGGASPDSSPIDLQLIRLPSNTLMNPPFARLTFLGTSSMMPTKTRNVSSVALQFGVITWLFDAGEGTQHQINKSRSVRASGIDRIFITHLHGDHFFGLPGILCSLCNASRSMPVEIVGPPGLRKALRMMLKASAVALMFRYTVHELHPRPRKGPPMESGTQLRESRVDAQAMHSQEDAGYDVIANVTGEWENLPFLYRSEQDMGLTVHAAPLKHSNVVPCIGYVVSERDYPGRMMGGAVKAEIMGEANRAFFKAKRLRNPLRLLAMLKAGRSVQLHDRWVHPQEVLGPPKKGRKCVILGDTYDPSAIARLAANADILIHEATNAYLPELDSADGKEGVTELSVLRKTLSHGHSTPEMAGAFAEAINCKHLVLTHFSPRYAYAEALPPKTVTGADGASASGGGGGGALSSGGGSANGGGEQEVNNAAALLEGIRIKAKSRFAGHVSLAHDFAEIEIPREGTTQGDDEDDASAGADFAAADASGGAEFGGSEVDFAAEQQQLQLEQQHQRDSATTEVDELARAERELTKIAPEAGLLSFGHGSATDAAAAARTATNAASRLHANSCARDEINPEVALAEAKKIAQEFLRFMP
jgi:ribonuclease Z